MLKPADPLVSAGPVAPMCDRIYVLVWCVEGEFSEVRLDGVLGKFASPWPYTFYPSFTEDLRLFNTEQRGRVYSVGGPGSTAQSFSDSFRSPHSLAAGRSPSCLCC